jgi:hypothetical protein
MFDITAFLIVAVVLGERRSGIAEVTNPAAG